jgi:hypothetical protein
LQQLPEGLAYDLRLLTDLPVPKAYGDDATAQQVILLLSIVSLLIRVAMLAAINLDGNARLSAVKVQGVRSHRMFPTKLVACETAVA